MRDRYANLREGLVGAWCPSIRGSGFTLPDLSGYGNHGTLTNMASDDWVSGQYGRALDFDGSNDHVLLPNISSLRPDTLTVSAWFLDRVGQPPSGALTPGIVYSFATSTPTGNDWALALINGRVRYASGDKYRDDATQLSTNTWYHLAYVRTASHAVYLNGVLLTTSSPNVSAGGGWTAGTSIGRWFAQNVYTLNGQTDDIRIYNRALSESEIRILASRPGIGLVPQRRVVYDAPKTRRRNHALIGNMF